MTQPQINSPAPFRMPPLPFLVPGILSLLLGLAAGLTRLPWELPAFGSVTMLHGPLMVSGFLGTVISVERAAALRRPWAWAVPALNGIGVLVLLFHAQLRSGLPFDAQQAGAILFAAGAVGLVAIFAAIVRKQPTLFNVVMGMGALAYVGANLTLLVGKPIATAVPFWSAFLVLTIAGERLELNRFLRPQRATKTVFLVIASLTLVGAALGLTSTALSDRIQGTVYLVLAAWLLRNDIARRTIRMTGVTRFTAACLLIGYAWLGVAGLSLVVKPGQIAGTFYDAALHSLFVGFVLSMIFGHAPIIVPALLGKAVEFRNRFYAPLVLLHASLLLRVGADHAQWMEGRRWGGLVNEIALVLYLILLVTGIRRARRS